MLLLTNDSNDHKHDSSDGLDDSKLKEMKINCGYMSVRSSLTLAEKKN